MKFDAIRISSAPEALVEQVLNQIRNATLMPGECLPSQRDLAKMFGVGLGTVREALRILDVMGVVAVLRGKGTFVSRDALSILNEGPHIENVLEAVSLSDLMKAREIVESGAARMAAEKADRDSTRQLREIGACLLSKDLDSMAYYENDFRFHVAVAEAAQNQAVLEIVKLLLDKVHHHVDFMSDALGISTPATMEKCIGSAIQIIAHIEEGESQRAEAAMRKHLDTVNEGLLKEFPVQRLRSAQSFLEKGAEERPRGHRNL